MKELAELLAIAFFTLLALAFVVGAFENHQD